MLSSRWLIFCPCSANVWLWISICICSGESTSMPSDAVGARPDGVGARVSDSMDASRAFKLVTFCCSLFTSAHLSLNSACLRSMSRVLAPSCCSRSLAKVREIVMSSAVFSRKFLISLFFWISSSSKSCLSLLKDVWFCALLSFNCDRSLAAFSRNLLISLFFKISSSSNSCLTLSKDAWFCALSASKCDIVSAAARSSRSFWARISLKMADSAFSRLSSVACTMVGTFWRP